MRTHTHNAKTVTLFANMGCNDEPCPPVLVIAIADIPAHYFLHLASVTGVIVLTSCECVCYHSHDRTDIHMDLNRGM